jgi:hypothetical protein
MADLLRYQESLSITDIFIPDNITEERQFIRYTVYEGVYIVVNLITLRFVFMGWDTTNFLDDKGV